MMMMTGQLKEYDGFLVNENPLHPEQELFDDFSILSHIKIMCVLLAIFSMGSTMLL